MPAATAIPLALVTGMPLLETAPSPGAIRLHPVAFYPCSTRWAPTVCHAPTRENAKLLQKVVDGGA